MVLAWNDSVPDKMAWRGRHDSDNGTRWEGAKLRKQRRVDVDLAGRKEL